MKEKLEGIFIAENGETIEEAEQLEVMKENFPHFLELLDTKILPELSNLVALMGAALPSEQLQVMLMDVENMQLHLKDLVEKGARKPFKDIPLEDTVIKDDENPFNSEIDQFSMVEEDYQEQFGDGGRPGPIVSEHVGFSETED